MLFQYSHWVLYIINIYGYYAPPHLLFISKCLVGSSFHPQITLSFLVGLSVLSSPLSLNISVDFALARHLLVMHSIWRVSYRLKKMKLQTSATSTETLFMLDIRGPNTQDPPPQSTSVCAECWYMLLVDCSVSALMLLFIFNRMFYSIFFICNLY